MLILEQKIVQMLFTGTTFSFRPTKVGALISMLFQRNVNIPANTNLLHHSTIIKTLPKMKKD